MVKNNEAAQARHVPVRTCRGCRKKFAKHELTRFVLAEGNVPVEDKKMILPGRGYYVCTEAACLEIWQRKPGVRKRGSRG